MLLTLPRPVRSKRHQAWRQRSRNEARLRACLGLYVANPREEGEPTTAQPCRSEKEKNILEDLSSSALSKFKKKTSHWKPEI